MPLPLRTHTLQANECPPLPSGLPTLDRQLHGGLPRGTVVELHGAVTTFKTQFALTLALNVAVAGSQVLILDGDGCALSVRLHAMARARAVDHALTRIQIAPLPDWTSLVALSHLLPGAVAQNSDVALIIVDSLTAPFRACIETAPLKRLEGVVSRLRALAVDISACVLVVTGLTRAESDSDGDGGWRFAVGTRLRTNRASDGGGIIEIVKSGVVGGNHMQPVEFDVETIGVIEAERS